MHCNYSKEELKCSGVYQIRNLTDNKIYVGSSFNLQIRKREHELDLKKNDHRNQHLQNAYNKYGKDSFIFEILEFLKPEDDQWNREQFWLNKLNACDKKIGYNIQTEVLVVPKQMKSVVCLETKEIFNSLEEASKKYNISSGSISCCCNKRKLKQTGGYHWRFYEEFINMSEKEVQEVIMDVKGYPFICLNDNKIYRNWRDLPYKKGSISRCCNLLAKGKYATCNGKRYMFLKDYEKLSEEDINKIKNLKPDMCNSGNVVCLETKTVFNHASEAMLQTGIDSASILKCCYNKAISANNSHWMFKKDYDKLSEKEIKKILSTQRDDSYVKAVVCLETREYFRSETYAAKCTGTSIHMINKMCKNGGINISKKTLHFVFASDYEKLTEQEVASILSKTKSNSKNK